MRGQNILASDNVMLSVFEVLISGSVHGIGFPINCKTNVRSPDKVLELWTSVATILSEARIFWPLIPGVKSYNLKYRIKNSGSAYSSPINNVTGSVHLSNLSNSTTYEYCFQTVCSTSNTSIYTATKTFTTLVNPCLTPNVNLFGTINKTSTSAKIYWAPVVDVLSYNVRYRKRNTGASYSSPIVTNDTSLVLSNLVQLTNYEFTVQSLCSLNSSSAISREISALTPAT